MGYLHEGHLSLVRRAKAENNLAGVSIFVNPTQFGRDEDFACYPRKSDRDLALLRAVDTDFVFMPSGEEIYPAGFNTYIEVFGLADCLEGAARPGHFRGVTTVVAKLLNIVEPARAYFGQKDAQQLLVIKKMTADLNMNIEIVGCPIVREPDGLAMSSRNCYLSQEGRRSAVVLSQSLFLAQKLWIKGECSSKIIRQEMADLISRESLVEICYISVADPATLTELEQIAGPVLVSLAAKVENTRLIDNIVLSDNSL
jgi:pantoate--beta-alanine ligase